MIYTLAKFFLWGLGFAVIGGVIGWLLRGRRCCQQLTEVRAGAVDREEADRLRHRVANLEPLIGERDALQARVAELEAAPASTKGGVAALTASTDVVADASADADVSGGALAAAEAAAADDTIDVASSEDPTLADGLERPELDDDRAVGTDGLVGLADGLPTTDGTDEVTTGAADTEVSAFAGGLSSDAAVDAPAVDVDAVDVDAVDVDAVDAPAVDAVAFDADAARAVLGTKVELDDLKIVEGIGPKLAEVLNAAGVTTWAGLAAMTPDAIRDVLVASDSRHRIHDPGTWPRQAELAHQGAWAELKVLQDELSAGR